MTGCGRTESSAQAGAWLEIFLCRVGRGTGWRSGDRCAVDRCGNSGVTGYSPSRCRCGWDPLRQCIGAGGAGYLGGAVLEDVANALSLTPGEGPPDWGRLEVDLP